MSLPDANSKLEKVLQIKDFVARSTGLRSRLTSSNEMYIYQCTDGKALSFGVTEIDDVIPRIDSEGKVFLQINFRSGKKILLTQNLVGFKPAPSRGLDLSKLPKVVTTPDLLSVVEAIEDSLSAIPVRNEELDILKRVFDSVLRGAEAVGFDTTSERVWLQGLPKNQRASC